MKPSSPSQTVLLIEDTPSLQMIYRSVLERAGFVVECCSTGAEGLAAFRRTRANVVLLDLLLPDLTGQEVMQRILTQAPDTNIVVITANGSINKAVELMRDGAHEFLVKPVDETRLVTAVETARATARSTPAAAPDAPADPKSPALPPFIGDSAPMQGVYSKIKSVARSMATVFVTGESGTGKELCAEAVHQTSARARGPFVALNCGAIPHDLLESEVFGHLKGSFTGAISDKIGAAAAADGGTLFLDEICEMDLNLQTKLLRVLQTSTITPVGATKPQKINLRIVCATNRDPQEEVRMGRFREDLYYRLHVVPIHMPPLRERGEDVITIAETLLKSMAKEESRVFDGFDEPVKQLFRTLPWPGNVRQLINVLRNVVVLNDGPLVTLDMLPPDLTARPRRQPDEGGAPPTPALSELAGKTLAEIERLVIEDALRRHGQSVPRAARELGVSPSTLYRKQDAWKRETP